MTELRIEDAIAAVRDAAVEGLRQAAKHVQDVSDAHAPIERKHLIESSRTTVDADTLTAAVSYRTDYAVRQHEQMDLQHDPGRTPKFLEHAMTSEAGEVTKIIAEQIHGRLGD